MSDFFINNSLEANLASMKSSAVNRNPDLTDELDNVITGDPGIKDDATHEHRRQMLVECFGSEALQTVRVEVAKESPKPYDWAGEQHDYTDSDHKFFDELGTDNPD